MKIIFYADNTNKGEFKLINSSENLRKENSSVIKELNAFLDEELDNMKPLLECDSINRIEIIEGDAVIYTSGIYKEIINISKSIDTNIISGVYLTMR